MVNCKNCVIYDKCTAQPGDGMCQLSYQEKTHAVAKDDDGKEKLTRVPRKIIWAISAVRDFGTKKYGDPENWRTVQIEQYRDAAFRHFLAYLDDPTGVDAESGLPHLYHLATNVAFLIEMEDL